MRVLLQFERLEKEGVVVGFLDNSSISGLFSRVFYCGSEYWVPESKEIELSDSYPNTIEFIIRHIPPGIEIRNLKVWGLMSSIQNTHIQQEAQSG